MAKYEAKTKPTEVGVETFIAAILDPRRREEAVAIDAMLRRVSGMEPRMWGSSIIGYGAYHYRYESGHEGDSARIGFSPRKAKLVLYLVGNYRGRQAETDALFAKLGKYSTAKACLYITRLANVDMAVLERIAKLSWDTMTELYPPSA